MNSFDIRASTKALLRCDQFNAAIAVGDSCIVIRGNEQIRTYLTRKAMTIDIDIVMAETEHTGLTRIERIQGVRND